MPGSSRPLLPGRPLQAPSLQARGCQMSSLQSCEKCLLTISCLSVSRICEAAGRTNIRVGKGQRVPGGGAACDGVSRSCGQRGRARPAATRSREGHGSSGEFGHREVTGLLLRGLLGLSTDVPPSVTQT